MITYNKLNRAKSKTTGKMMRRAVKLDTRCLLVIVVSLLPLALASFAHGIEARRPMPISSPSTSHTPSVVATGTPTGRATSAKILNTSHDDRSSSDYPHSSSYSASSDSSESNPYDTSFTSSDDDSITEDMQQNYKPTDLSVIRLSNSSVVLKWDFPLEVPDNLQFFKIQYRKTSKGQNWITENKEIPPFLRAYQLNGLKPGNYNFVVLAVVGEDNFSSDSIKYKLRAQSKIPADDMPNQEAPNIFWWESEYDLIRFKWRYNPKARDVTNFGFLVYYRAAHQVSEFYIHNTMDENVEIAEVEPDTPYEAKVVAYNEAGVSEFSKVISVKTKSKMNETSATTTISPSASESDVMISLSTTTTTTTARPGLEPSDRHQPSNSVSLPDEEQRAKPVRPPYETDLNHHKHPGGSGGTTTKPLSPSRSNNTTTNNNNIGSNNSNSTASSVVESFVNSIFDTLHLDHSDASLLIRRSLIITIPLVFVIFILCLITCHKRKQKSPPSSTNDSMQFDLEINGYFKNSFPGVEKEYPTLNTHNAHHGFVNNHPHINDFT